MIYPAIQNTSSLVTGSASKRAGGGKFLWATQTRTLHSPSIKREFSPRKIIVMTRLREAKVPRLLQVSTEVPWDLLFNLIPGEFPYGRRRAQYKVHYVEHWSFYLHRWLNQTGKWRHESWGSIEVGGIPRFQMYLYTRTQIPTLCKYRWSRVPLDCLSTSILQRRPDKRNVVLWLNVLLKEPWENPTKIQPQNWNIQNVCRREHKSGSLGALA